jgi:glyoxalase family protein
MEPKITKGFHHITMVAADAPTTLAFYEGLLGLSLVKKTVNYDDPGTNHLYFGNESGAPGTILTFFEWPGIRRGGWGVGGIHHLALGVDTPKAQLRWKRRLMDAGTPVSGPFDRGYFRSIYFRDPDGQVLEIATNGPGYGIDEPLHALGERLIEPDPSRLPGGRDEEAIRRMTYEEPVARITDGMRLRGIHHITGITDDLEKAGAFYEATLGLRLVKRTLNQDDGKTKHYFWANYDGVEVGPHSSLTLFGWPGSTHHVRPGTGQTHHIAFRAKSGEEQSAWREHLLGMGIQVSPVMDRKYFRSIYFQAPDGLLLEIATDGPGFTVDEEPQALGSNLQLPEWLEGDREP